MAAGKLDFLIEKARDAKLETNDELLDDSDNQLELQDSIKDRLEASQSSPKSEPTTTPAQDVAAKLGLDW